MTAATKPALEPATRPVPQPPLPLHPVGPEKHGRGGEVQRSDKPRCTGCRGHAMTTPECECRPAGPFQWLPVKFEGEWAAEVYDRCSAHVWFEGRPINTMYCWNP